MHAWAAVFGRHPRCTARICPSGLHARAHVALPSGWRVRCVRTCERAEFDGVMDDRLMRQPVRRSAVRAVPQLPLAQLSRMERVRAPHGS